MIHTATQWLRVKRSHPCPICQKPDWCTYSADGSAACCMRVESNKTMRNGGWLHRLSEAQTRDRFIPPPRRQPVPEAAPVDWDGKLLAWRAQTRPVALGALAASLGVSQDALARLGAAWAAPHAAWAFPMVDADRETIGIRLRNIEGKKWAVMGSHNGVFWPEGILGDLEAGPLLFCEGPTTCASMLDLGYSAIGRPNCGACNDLAIGIAAAARRDVVLLADDDRNGAGERGAKALALELRKVVRSVKVILPLEGKDGRDWVRAGATREVVDAVINNANYFRG